MTTREKVIKIISSQQVLGTFANLYSRWQDERGFEPFDEYIKVMVESVEKVCGSISMPKGTKAPFGLRFGIDGDKFHVFLKRQGACVRFMAKQE